MATKQIIYQERQEGKNFSTTPVKSLLYRHMCMEEYRANIKGTLNSFMMVWGPAFFELINLFQS